MYLKKNQLTEQNVAVSCVAARRPGRASQTLVSQSVVTRLRNSTKKKKYHVQKF